jgi:hypothetical protein
MRNSVAIDSFIVLRNSVTEELTPRIAHVTDPIEVRYPRPVDSPLGATGTGATIEAGTAMARAFNATRSNRYLIDDSSG